MMPVALTTLATGVDSQMPSFVQPPQVNQYLVEICVNECITVPTFESLVNAFNGFLADWYNWITSASFPNVLYDATLDKFYYYEGGAFHDFEDFPNVLVKDGVLKYKSGGIFDLQAYSIKNNVFYDSTQTEYLRLANGTATGEAIYPYLNCVKYEPGTATWQYHDATGWHDFAIKPPLGSLALQSGVVKSWQGSAFTTANLPYRNGDLREDSGYIWKYNSGLWSKFYFEGQIRATDNNQYLEVYRSGNWVEFYRIF